MQTIFLIIFNEVKGLYNSVIASCFETANQMALQLCGLGDLKPNTLMMGFKEDWKIKSESLNEQVQIEIFISPLFYKSFLFSLFFLDRNFFILIFIIKNNFSAHDTP